MSNILFVGAHPDDIEVGCGGTVIEHIKNGDNVVALIVTDGDQGLSKYKKDHNRLEETTSALTLSGIKNSNLIFLHLSDTSLWKERDMLLTSIEKIFEKYDIDRVYTHTDKSYHQDHITVSEETVRALRNDRKTDILAYETNGSTKPIFFPSYFVDIGNVLDMKLDMLNCHKSQKEKFTNNCELIIALARFRASQAKLLSYAEAFEVIRMSWKRNGSNV